MLNVNPTILHYPDARKQYQNVVQLLDAARAGETAPYGTYVSQEHDSVRITHGFQNDTVQISGQYQNGKLQTAHLASWEVLGECWPTRTRTFRPESEDRVHIRDGHPFEADFHLDLKA